MKTHKYEEPLPFDRTPSRVEVKSSQQEMDAWFDQMTQQAEEEFNREVDKKHGSRAN